MDGIRIDKMRIVVGVFFVVRKYDFSNTKCFLRMKRILVEKQMSYLSFPANQVRA